MLLSRLLFDAQREPWRRTILRRISAGTPLYLGILCGGMLCCWWACVLSLVGGSLSTTTGLLLAATIGAAAGWARPRNDRPDAASGVRLICLAAWTAVLPLLAPAPFGLLRWIPWSWMSSPSLEFLFGFLCGGCLLAAPHWVLAHLAATAGAAPHEAAHQRGGPSTPPAAAPATASLRERLLATWITLWTSVGRSLQAAPSLTGIAIGLLAMSIWLAPAVGLFPASLGVMALTGLWGLAQIFPPAELESPPEQNDSERRRPEEQRSSPRRSLLDVLPPIAAAGLLVMAGRVTSQLWLQGLYCTFALLAGMLLGMRVGGACGARWFGSPADSGRARGFIGLSTLFAASLALAGSAAATDGTLWLNAHVSSGWLIITIRAFLTCLFACPAGIVLGFGQMSGSAREERSWSALLMMLAVLAWIVIRWSCPAPMQAFWSALIAGGGLIAGSLVQEGRRVSAGWRPRTLLACGLLLCLATVLGVGSFDASRSARLLFSSRVSAAAQSSADDILLDALDDARWLDAATGRDSTWTIWKRRGDWISIRENGVPFGDFAQSSELTPEAPAELMAATLPLAVHPRADHVLLVGLGSTGALRACLDFPIRTVTCLEPDPDWIALAKKYGGAAFKRCLDDPRTTLNRVLPTLASAGNLPRRYDVILLNERQLVGGRALGTAGVEVYRRWATHLTPEGLLCLRIEYVDLGAAPLRNLARTLRTVFPQVVFWESAPGEMTALATRSERPMIQESLLTQFSQPHVRRLMGRVGWDWSLPFTFITVQGDGLEALMAPGRAAFASTALFDLSLPLEIARWGNKGGELQGAVSAAASTPISLLPESPARADLQKRIADVGEQRSLITRFPDHYWAYRKVLKERLQDRPRVDVLRVGLELHPEDEHRKEYLKTLGNVATLEHPEMEQVDRLVEYAEPFDPLVSPFLHGEAARLYNRCREGCSAAEMREWLHVIYFGAAFDRSVRDSVAALTLLVEHPEAMPEEQRRWDHINSLLEILRERWGMRSQVSAPSKYDLGDATEALTAAKRAVAYLEDHADAAGVDADWADARCRVLDRTLIRALRTYHAEQMAKLRTIEREREARVDSNVVH